MIKMESLNISDKEHTWKWKLSIEKSQNILKEHENIIQYM